MADVSYTYLSYHFDEVDEESVWASVGDIGQLIEVFGPNEKSEKLPVQFGMYVDVLYSLINTDPDKLLTVLESDIDLDAFYDSHGNSSTDSGTSGMLFRLRDKVIRFSLDDQNVNAWQSTTPVLFDNIKLNLADWNHSPVGSDSLVGSNVLYMDGHVSFVRFEEKGVFPVNRSFASVMGAMRSHPTFRRE